jgi:hypothetical protein
MTKQPHNKQGKTLNPTSQERICSSSFCLFMQCIQVSCIEENPGYGIIMDRHHDKTAQQQMGPNLNPTSQKKENLQQRFLSVHAVDPKLMYGFCHKSRLWNKHGHTRRQNSPTANEKKP